jgi:hypothetical protein
MSTNIPPSSLDELQVPEEFYKIISDFTGDILITFGGTVEVPAAVIFIHPLHNYTVYF